MSEIQQHDKYFNNILFDIYTITILSLILLSSIVNNVIYLQISIGLSVIYLYITFFRNRIESD